MVAERAMHSKLRRARWTSSPRTCKFVSHPVRPARCDRPRGSARPAPRERRVARVDTETNGLGATCASSPRSAACSSAAASCTTRWTRSCARSARCRAGSSASPGSPRRWWTARRRRTRCCRSCRAARGPGAGRPQRALRPRVLRQAFERAGLDWPAPPALCTVALARRFARSPASAGSRRWPTRSGSRWTRSTGRCPTRSRARGSSARSSRGCARTR